MGEQRQVETAETPYVSARRKWNDHVGEIVSARNLWQVVALLSLLLAVGAIGILAQIATRSHFVPYIVEVHRDGTVEAVKRAAEMRPLSRAVIEAQLEEFITQSRRVTVDVALQRAAVYSVFAKLSEGDPAARKMKAYLQGEGHPVERAKSVTVSTEIESVLPQTDRTWQVDWTETVYGRDGERKEHFQMRALVEVYQSQPLATTEEAMRANPLSIYIKDFYWGRRGLREVRP